MLNYQNIPPELKTQRFINWSLVGSNKIPVKPPDFDKEYRGFLKSNHSLDECIDHCEKHPKLGFGLLTGDGIGCIDIDRCNKNFSIHHEAEKIIENQNSFTEYSYSALNSNDGVGGLHVIGEIDKRFESLRKTYTGFGWHEEGRIDLLGKGKFVAVTLVGVNPAEVNYDSLYLDYDFFTPKSPEIESDTNLLQEVRTFKLDSKHLVNIENRLSNQRVNGTKYSQLMAGVYENFHRYRPSAVNDLAQAVCYYSTSDQFWEKRGVGTENKKLLALGVANSVLSRSDLGWRGFSDENQIECLLRAYNYFEVDGTPKYGDITPEFSARQRAISHANNNREVKADNDSRIRQAIDKIGLGNKRAIARESGVGKNTVYRFIRENDITSAEGLTRR